MHDWVICIGFTWYGIYERHSLFMSETKAAFNVRSDSNRFQDTVRQKPGILAE